SVRRSEVGHDDVLAGAVDAQVRLGDRAGVVLHYEQHLLTGGRRVATDDDRLLDDPFAAVVGGQAELPDRRQLHRGDAGLLEVAQRVVDRGQTGLLVHAVVAAPGIAGEVAGRVRSALVVRRGRCLRRPRG